MPETERETKQNFYRVEVRLYVEAQNQDAALAAVWEGIKHNPNNIQRDFVAFKANAKVETLIQEVEECGGKTAERKA